MQLTFNELDIVAISELIICLFCKNRLSREAPREKESNKLTNKQCTRQSEEPSDDVAKNLLSMETGNRRYLKRHYILAQKKR